VTDERSILFEKQRGKLRKLLSEYDGFVSDAMQSDPRGGAAGVSRNSPTKYGVFGDNFGSRDAALAGATATRVIREESRLSLNELSAWFAQAGAEEMPGMTIAIVERVYSHLTRTNGDGRASIRDLRRWYISFGKRALADGLTAADLERELVPSKVS
jgi:hypothetical protein